MTLHVECLTVDCSSSRGACGFLGGGARVPTILRGRHRDRDLGTRRIGTRPTCSSSGSRTPRSVKNRLHLDLRPDDRDAEVARLEALGAARVEIGQQGDESWVVMADPEGNEFCVLRALAPGDSVYEGDVGFSPSDS